MRKFEYIQDVEKWLEPMGYDEFWVKLAPYGIDAAMRTDCETGTAKGTEPDKMLSAMKSLTRIELTERFGLTRRPMKPWVRLVENH